MKDLLGQPEYLHVLVNPLLTHALPLAALGLLVALACRSRAAARLALVLVALAAASAWPAVHYGHAGYDRVRAMADSAGGDWLDVHRYRAEKLAWAFYVTLALALAALVTSTRWPKGTATLAWLALAAAIASSGAAAYIAYPGGRVRHREFRHGPPPADELKAAQADVNP